MTKTAAALGAALLLLLTGCASSAEPESTPRATPSAEVSPNLEACKEFARVTSTMANKINGDGNGNDVWEELRVEFDEAALRADDVVQDRMISFVESWPELSGILIYGDVADFNAGIDAVDRACAADGAEVTVYKFAE